MNSLGRMAERTPMGFGRRREHLVCGCPVAYKAACRFEPGFPHCPANLNPCRGGVVVKGLQRESEVCIYSRGRWEKIAGIILP